MTSNCAQATRLLSDSQDRTLEPGELQDVKKHLEICPACVRFEEQLAMLRTFMRHWCQHVEAQKTDTDGRPAPT
jgi:predicted anti-sigma-YlaC factor YlaD